MPQRVLRALKREEDWSREAWRAIADVALAVAEELDPKRAARVVVDQALRVLGADGVLLWEVAEGGEHLSLLAHRHIPAPMLLKVRSISFSAPTLSSRAAASGALQVQEDMREAAPELTITREFARSYGFRSMVAVPLKARGRLVGVMTYMTKTPRAFGDEQLETVKAIGRIFAVGLDNAKAYAREVALLSEVQALVASSPEGILLLAAPTGRVLLSNEATREILGRPIVPEAGIASYPQLYGLRQASGAPCSAAELPPARAFRGQTVLGVQMLIRQPSGRAVPVLVNAAPVRDKSGAVVAAVVLFQDISRLKELEREREQMTSIIAHDLRAPITVIAGFAEILLRKAADQQLPEPTRQGLRRIRTSAQHLDRLVGDLLDVARLETRRLSLRRQWVDLPALVRDTLARLSAAITTHHPELKVHGEVPAVWADPGRVEQVLTNLLTNAAKYSPPGTPVSVTLRRQDNAAVVSVADRGPGIPPADLAHIFDRYYRVRQSRTLVEGFGLGLYISKGLVEALGGRIWVESTVGAGTTFHFTLPTEPHASRPRHRPAKAARERKRDARAQVASRLT